MPGKVYSYIYIMIEKGREREREGDSKRVNRMTGEKKNNKILGISLSGCLGNSARIAKHYHRIHFRFNGRSI